MHRIRDQGVSIHWVLEDTVQHRALRPLPEGKELHH